MYVIIFGSSFDLIIVDQIAYTIPLLKLFKKKVLYYCHFPEALLNDNKPTKINIAYRKIFDSIENFSISFSDYICFNSKFTEETTLSTFKKIEQNVKKREVLYPCVEIPVEELNIENSDKKYFLSLNRFETRKNIKRALSAYLENFNFFKEKGIRIKIAGGYKSDNPDSVSCLQELKKYAKENSIEDYVDFELSVDNNKKEKLLR